MECQRAEIFVMDRMRLGQILNFADLLFDTVKKLQSQPGELALLSLAGLCFQVLPLFLLPDKVLNKASILSGQEAVPLASARATAKNSFFLCLDFLRMRKGE